MSKIEANASEVLETYKSASEPEKLLMIKLFGKETFKSLDNDWLNVFEIFCRENGIGYSDFMKKYSILEEDELAYKMLKEIHKVSNGAWKADYKDKKQEKHFPVFTFEKSAFVFANTDDCWTYTYTNVGSRLCSVTAEKAEFLGRKYVKIFEKIYD